MIPCLQMLYTFCTDIRSTPEQPAGSTWHMRRWQKYIQLVDFSVHNAKTSGQLREEKREEKQWGSLRMVEASCERKQQASEGGCWKRVLAKKKSACSSLIFFFPEKGGNVMSYFHWLWGKCTKGLTRSWKVCHVSTQISRDVCFSNAVTVRLWNKLGNNVQSTQALMQAWKRNALKVMRTKWKTAEWMDVDSKWGEKITPARNVFTCASSNPF